MRVVEPTRRSRSNGKNRSTSEADINPDMETLQATTRAIAEAVKDPAERERVDKVIRERAFADFGKAAPVLGHGSIRRWKLFPTRDSEAMSLGS